MKSNRIATIGSIALLCAACSAAPNPGAAAQPAATPAATPATPVPAAISAASQPTGNPLLAQAQVSQATAAQTALAKVANGTIKDAELEEENGLLVWSFDIATPGSANITEIQVDAHSGKIVATEHETPADQARETAADRQAKP